MSRFVHVAGSITSVIANTQRKEVAVPIYVGSNGYVQNAGYEIRPVPALENGPLDGPRAIVLHRTDSTTTEGTIRSFERGVGTHFLVGKDGAVIQAASLLQKTAHVGKIRSRCHITGTCSAEEQALIDSWGWAPSRIHSHERDKPYPIRFPTNEDSVGIETVAKFDKAANVWEAPTVAQASSIARLIGILKSEYGLTNADIYEHDEISYKQGGEGAGLYGSDGDDRLPVRLAPPFL